MLLATTDNLPADLGIGDDATPVAGAALDSESAEITQSGTQEIPPKYTDSDGDTNWIHLFYLIEDYREDRVSRDTVRAVIDNWRNS